MEERDETLSKLQARGKADSFDKSIASSLLNFEMDGQFIIDLLTGLHFQNGRFKS